MTNIGGRQLTFWRDHFKISSQQAVVSSQNYVCNLKLET